uniref:Flavin-containing monooxygenase n=1 Tax=Nicotiana tabacum TaxID=4097 RepID=A0A1S4CDS5_TOBAC|nr:PREDICTED: probable flavin-containing monooxygenase 1 [Nicotiana tabacum]
MCGVWTKTIGSTKLQTPKPLYQFSDFPWLDSVTDVFSDQRTVLEYIESYARHFDLLRHIQFNSKVLSLSYESGGDSDGEWNLWGGTGEPFSTKGKWNVSVQDTRTLSTQVYQADFVVVCVGRFSQVPNIPKFLSMKCSLVAASESRFQFSSNMAPKNEFLPALPNVVAVVSKILPPTLSFTLSFWLSIIQKCCFTLNFKPILM